MNCLEFRRRLLIEPGSREKAFVEHAAGCRECAREAERAFRFERQLCVALDVAPPPGLESRVLAAREGAGNGVSRRGAFPWFAWAVSVVLTIGVAGWLGYNWDRYFVHPSGLERAVLHHINDELEHLHEDRDIRAVEVGSLLSQFGAAMQGDIGHINFASRCNIRKYSGLHLVVPGQQGPVTVLIMPGEYLKGKEAVRSSRFAGLIVPTRYGSIAVVGEKNEPVQDVVERVRQVIVWGA